MRYECDLCSRVFGTAIGLRNHMMYHERLVEEAGEKGVEELVVCRFAGTVSARLLVAEGSAVRLYVMVNGKSREQVDTQ